MDRRQFFARSLVLVAGIGILSTLTSCKPKPANTKICNIDPSKCTGCGHCIDSCKHKAISINDKTGKAEINQDRCKACGDCVKSCRHQAISIEEKKKQTT